MDFLDAFNSFFDCEEIPKHQKVKITKSKLKGFALTWWNFTQIERVKMENNHTSKWKRMEAFVKEAYVPKDYEVQLHTKRQNLR